MRENLKNFRESKGLSIAKFCEDLNLTAADYIDYENAGKLPVSTLIAIYKKYDLDLIGRDSEKLSLSKSI